jgi:capsule polysaccharide export protein KpsE/RkpR
MADIDVCLKAAIEQLATQTKLAIENGDAALNTIIDDNYQDLLDKINALTSENLADQLAALKALVDSLDLDEDSSVVNDLLNIKSIAEQALDAALTAGENADAANTKADNLLTQLASYQTSVDTQLGTINTTLSNHADAIAALQACCNDAVTQADIDNSIQTNNDKICTALNEAVATFTNILNGSTGGSGDGSGGGDVI